MRRYNSVLTILISISIVLASLVPTGAEKATGQTIRISSPEDLIQFSQSSSLDSWSQGKTIILDRDIDLENKEFEPIPIFKGVFDGQGHTIRGLSINSQGANYGLFRYLEEEGRIKNLNVEAKLDIKGDRNNIGGIVGHNSGVIENVNFSGSVKGKDSVGGLVGRNTSSGRIINSSCLGSIYGESKVGGIVGFNAGTIINANNKSDVNTTIDESQEGQLDIDLNEINISKLTSDSMDIGGVAGLNTGIIKDSKNTGRVGYESKGYNIGGIAGRQSGYILKSINEGDIYGRKDVAGIVGQMEPHVNTLVSTSKLGQLQEEMNTLQAYIKNMVARTKNTSGVLSENFLQIQEDIEKGQSHLKSLAEQTEDFIDKGIDELGKIDLILVEVMASLDELVGSFSKVIDDINRTLPLLDKALSHISKVIEDLPLVSAEYSGLVDALNRSKEDAEELEKAIGRAETSLEGLGQASDREEISSLIRELEALGLGQLLENNLNNFEDLESIIGDLDGLDENEINKALDYLGQAIDIMKGSRENIDDIIESLRETLDYIEAQPPLDFEFNDEEYERTREELFTSMDNISKSISVFVKNMDRETSILMDSMERISDQLFKVMGILFNIVEDLTSGGLDPGKIIKDVSSQDIEDAREGKVDSCSNFGKIRGDLNSAGIAGNMGIEFEFDPEEDLKLGNRVPYDAVYQTRAIILNGKNKGDIIGRKDNVGGIVGSQDLGYIKDSQSDASIISKNGDYVGGIAGQSKGPIVASYSKSQLEGRNYIGGIAGLGKEIRNSYALVNIEDGSAYLGGIAGNLDRDGKLRNNYFVSDSLRGIDGISYEKKAETIDYEKLMTVEGIPNIFKEFQVDFLLEDKKIGSLDFNYGDSIDAKNFPDIPEKEGYYGQWTDFRVDNLIFDREIKAEYIPYVSLLDSREKRDGPLSLILVEGEFKEEDSIRLNKKNKTSIDGKESMEIWEIEIPDDGSDTHTIRYHPPEAGRKLAIYLLNNQGWEKVRYKRDGKYLVFVARGNPVTMGLVNEGSSPLVYILIAGLGLTAISLFIYKRRKGKSQD